MIYFIKKEYYVTEKVSILMMETLLDFIKRSKNRIDQYQSSQYHQSGYQLNIINSLICKEHIKDKKSQRKQQQNKILKMLQSALFVILNLIFNILNLYIAFSTYNHGENVFFVPFWIIFGIEKLMFLSSDGPYKILKIIFIDIYLFKNLFTSNIDVGEFNNDKAYKVLFNTLPFLFLNGIYSIDESFKENFFFLFGIQMTILVIGSLLFISKYADDDKLDLQDQIQTLVAHLSYFLSLKTMLLLSDPLGISLYYYQLLGYCSSFIILCVYMPPEKFCIFVHIIKLFDGVLNNYQFELIKLNKRSGDFYQRFIINNICYFSSLCRLILTLLCTNLKQLIPNFNQDSNVDLTSKLVTLLAIFFTLVYLLIEFKELKNSTISHKYLPLAYFTEIEDATNEIQKLNNNIKEYYIYCAFTFKLPCCVYYLDFNDQIQRQNYLRFTQGDQEKENQCHFYNLQRAISQRIKQKKKVHCQLIDPYRQACQCQLIKLCIEQEFIHDVCKRLLRIQNKDNSTFIFFERFKNGYILTEINEIIMLKFKPEERQCLKEMIATQYTIIAFQKHINSFLTTLPQFVQYDLFAND